MKRLSLTVLMLGCTLHADWSDSLLKKGSTLYDETREKTLQIYKDTLQSKPLNHEEMRKQRLNNAWDGVVDQLKEGTGYIDELKQAPDSAWIGKDKEDIREDLNALFDRIVKGLVGSDLMAYKEQISDIKEKIAENNENILSYREKRIGAPVSSTLYRSSHRPSATMACIRYFWSWWSIFSKNISIRSITFTCQRSTRLSMTPKI